MPSLELTLQFRVIERHHSSFNKGDFHLEVVNSTRMSLTSTHCIYNNYSNSSTNNNNNRREPVVAHHCNPAGCKAASWVPLSSAPHGMAADDTSHRQRIWLGLQRSDGWRTGFVGRAVAQCSGHVEFRADDRRRLSGTHSLGSFVRFPDTAWKDHWGCRGDAN